MGLWLSGWTGSVLLHVFLVISESGLRLEERDEGWVLAGRAAARFGLVNEFLGYLADRNYSPRTVRAYGFDLLAFCRWLVAERAARCRR